MLQRATSENSSPIYELWTNIVTEGEKTTPIYEVWKGIVTEGYERKNFIPMYEVGMNIVTEGEKRKEPVETGSLELRIAGSMKKI